MAWPDPSPEGYISLFEAFRLFVLARHGGTDPVVAVDQEHALRQYLTEAETELAAAFERGELDAYVWSNGQKLKLEHWHKISLPTRPFSSDRIFDFLEDGPWSSLHGRTPFTEKSKFDEWLTDYVQEFTRTYRTPYSWETRERTDRDDLIDAVCMGNLTPHEAEQQAAKLGLAPLAHKPDPADFDPNPEVFWSIPMALAWVIWRNADAVREQWNIYRSECWDWESMPLKHQDGGVMKRRLAHRPAATTKSPSLMSSPSGVSLTTGDLAKGMLWRELQAGKIQAYGLRSMQDGPIPAHLWSILDDRDARDLPVYAAKGAEAAYRNVRVKATAVKRLWPDNSSIFPQERAIGRKSPAIDAVLRALEALQHDDTFNMAYAQIRNDRIRKWCTDNGYPSPSDPSILRAIRQWRVKSRHDVS